MPLHGKAPDNHGTPASPALSTCAADVAGAQLGALGMQGARLIPISSHLYILTPSSPVWTSQHILSIYSLLKEIPSPGNTSPFHTLNSEASQQDHNLLVLPVA